MEKVLKIYFDKSDRDIKLYNWIITHENMEKLVKDTLMEKMNNDLNENLFDANFFRIEKTSISDDKIYINKRQKLRAMMNESFWDIKPVQEKQEYSSKDLEDIFNDDSFWD